MTRNLLPALAVLLAACAQPPINVFYDPVKPHHTAEGFVNTVPDAVQAGKGSFLAMMQRRWRGDFEPKQEPAGGYEAFAAAWSTPVDRELIGRRHAEPLVTWLGHATMLLQVGGLNILVDPQFSSHAGPWSVFGARRRVPVPIMPADLPPIDLVLISHNHYDHLDAASIRRLDAIPGNATRYLVPLGVKAWFDDQGIGPVEELDWWMARQFGEVAVHFTPAQHWSKRTPWDTNRSLWGGFALFYWPGGIGRPSVDPWRFLYTGDTGYSPDFAEIRKRLGRFDLLAAPVGAYEPRDFMAPQHINPDEALQIMEDVGARRLLGVHWGTFELTQEAFDRPPQDLEAARRARGIEASRIWLFKHGESRRVPR
jgi:L-ascorbate metabolism protein UlaG (beta-lactamase superfamily)